MKDTAVVIGGSVSGLITATVLSKYFKNVFIIERNVYKNNESAVNNRQGHQPHIVMQRGYEILNQLFPNFMKEFEEEEKEKNRILNQLDQFRFTKFVFNGKVLSNAGVKMGPCLLWTSTRGEIESFIRRRMERDVKNVKFYDGYQVLNNQVHVESILDKNGKEQVKVTGVTIKRTDNQLQQQDSATTSTSNQQQLDSITINCDLLVNCGGLGSKTLCKNIESKLNKTIRRSFTEFKIRYESVYFKVKDDVKLLPNNMAPVSKLFEREKESACRNVGDEFNGVYHPLMYPNMKSFLVFPVENNRIIISLISSCDHVERLNNLTALNAKEKILNYVKGTPLEEDMINILNICKEEADSIHPPYEKLGNEYNHYEELFPVSQFLAIGDSVGSLNPVYGQGIASAFDSAILLDDKIKKEIKNCNKVDSIFDSDFCKEFQQQLCYAYFIPWLLAVTGDFSYTTKYSNNLWWQKLLNPIMQFLTDRMFEAGNKNIMGTFYFIMLLTMRDGYRKLLFNINWLALLFARELKVLAFIVPTVAVIIAAVCKYCC
ncbi:hypothetical protein ABK040_002858 [Willaertia magna]